MLHQNVAYMDYNDVRMRRRGKGLTGVAPAAGCAAVACPKHTNYHELVGLCHRLDIEAIPA